MPERTLLERVMSRYKRAWETRDAELAAALFTEDATYQEHPFHEPILGQDGIRRYWEGATGKHRDVEFAWTPVVSSGALHIIEWSAKFTRSDAGRRYELRGAMILEFRGERIERLREYWLRNDLA